MSAFVFVCEDEATKHEGVELPTEEDGSLLLSVLQSQYEGASGLKYRNPATGLWRAVKLLEGVLHPPDDSWKETPYIVVRKAETHPQPSSVDATATAASTDGYKRKMDTPTEVEGERAAKNPRSTSPDFSNLEVRDLNREDLIVLGLEYSVNDAELMKYFSQFGEVAAAEVKKDMKTMRSRGFGFVRYFDPELQAKVQAMKHTIKGRKVDIKYPKKSASYIPSKVFVGCLPLKPEVTTGELQEYFSQYGELADVYIPQPYRGFGFVTFQDGTVAQKVISTTHSFRKSTLNLSIAEPKGARSQAPVMSYHGTTTASFDPYRQWYDMNAAYGSQQSGAYATQGVQYGAFNVQQSQPNFPRGAPPQSSHVQEGASGYQQSRAGFQHGYQQQGYLAQQQRSRAPPPPPPPSSRSPKGPGFQPQGASYGVGQQYESGGEGDPQYVGYRAEGYGSGKSGNGSVQDESSKSYQQQQDSKVWQNY